MAYPRFIFKILALACPLLASYSPALQAAQPAAGGPTPAIVALSPIDRQDVVVFRQPGRYGGWPANGGAWSWGNEILVGFTAAWYKPAKNDHAVDRSKPFEKWQARSVDGGRTWSIEKPAAFAADRIPPRPPPLGEPLDFTHPDFALVFHFLSMHSGPSYFFASTDRGRNWQGPYSLDVEGIKEISTRTDYIVLGKHECLMFGSAAKADHKEGRPFCARTTDGGLHWKLVSLIGPEPAGFAIMPSTLRLADGVFLTAIRNGGKGVVPNIDLYRSEDRGGHWTLLGPATGDIGGNPPSLVRLKDGRVALTYGYRRKPCGARARISSDEGRSWGPEIILRDDGRTGDLGYPRSVVRPDGNVVTIYYFNGPRDEDRTIQATIWTPPAPSVLEKAQRRQAHPVTNLAIRQGDRAVALPDVKRPKVESVFLYQPESEWTYSHHASLVHFKGRFYAIWSNGRQDEDAPGQRVLISSSADFRQWTTPRPLVDSQRDNKGVERVLTAAGFHQHKGVLVAYFGNYGPKKETTRLQAVTTTDGVQWSSIREIGIPVNPNHGPQPTATGRLIIAGNISFPYSDHPSGLAGWKMTGIYPSSMAATIKDDPASFWEVASRQGWPVALCEGSFYQTDDHVLHMLLRNTGRHYPGRLWITESRDNGATWSEPALTGFTDANAKFHFGRLPDGRFYYVGNPLSGNRTPLVLSLSSDGIRFDRHVIIGEKPYPRRKPGLYKGGEYGYPHSIIHDGWLYVIVSRQKEAVEVLRIDVSQLGR